MKKMFLVLIAFAIGLTGWAQETSEEKLRKKIDRLMEEREAGLKQALADLVRREIAGKPASGDPAAALALITEDLVRGHVEFLADDRLQGRNSGYPGEEKAAEYIEKTLRAAGLEPAGEDGSYFQPFTVGRLQTRNCLGKLEGTDPVLKKEIVVIGAHHDHVGSVDEGTHMGRIGGPKGDDGIWNGADDNASGTSAVLAVAKAFGEAGVRTRRTVLFLTFSGEEHGLLGSVHYARHPIAPIGDHVFMLNLDMVGRNPEKAVQIQGAGSAEGGILRAAAERAVKKTGLFADVQDGVTLTGGDSDHSSFRNVRVPYSFFFTDFHRDYHRVGDHADKIAYENVAKIARTAFLLLQEIADAEERPKFQGSRPFRPPGLGEPGNRPRRRLGITPGDLKEEERSAHGLKKEEGAIRVTEVAPGSVAEKAGMKTEDVIVAVGGKPLSPDLALNELRDRISEAKTGEPIEIVVIREKERVTVKAEWSE